MLHIPTLPTTPADLETKRKPLSEARKERAVERVLDRVLEAHGFDRVFNHLDQLTKPPIAAE